MILLRKLMILSSGSLTLYDNELSKVQYYISKSISVSIFEEIHTKMQRKCIIVFLFFQYFFFGGGEFEWSVLEKS